MCKQEENVVLISLEKLQPFPGHPFQVRDDQLMQQHVDSIRNVGVLVPAIVRRTGEGTYQLIGGHRRKHACELLGLDIVTLSTCAYAFQDARYVVHGRLIEL